MKAALVKLHCAIFLWGFTGVFGRLISLNEGWLVWWRLFITVVTLWIFFGFKKKIPKITLRDGIKVGLIGTTLALHWLCFYGSIKYSNVSITLTCLSTSGLLAAIIEPLVFRRKISFAEIILGTFAIAGIAIIYLTNLKFSVGIYIGLIAALLSVASTVMNKKLLTNSSLNYTTITVYELTGGLAGLSILMPFYHHLFPTEHIFPTTIDWIWLLILSWICTIATYFLYLGALKQVSAFTMNITLTLEPVYGIILAFMIYHENAHLSNAFYIGFGLILFAVVLQTLRITRQRQAKPKYEADKACA